MFVVFWPVWFACRCAFAMFVCECCVCVVLLFWCSRFCRRILVACLLHTLLCFFFGVRVFVVAFLWRVYCARCSSHSCCVLAASNAHSIVFSYMTVGVFAYACCCVISKAHFFWSRFRMHQLSWHVRCRLVSTAPLLSCVSGQ